MLSSGLGNDQKSHWQAGRLPNLIFLWLSPVWLSSCAPVWVASLGYLRPLRKLLELSSLQCMLKQMCPCLPSSQSQHLKCSGQGRGVLFRCNMCIYRLESMCLFVRVLLHSQTCGYLVLRNFCWQKQSSLELTLPIYVIKTTQITSRIRMMMMIATVYWAPVMF